MNTQLKRKFTLAFLMTAIAHSAYAGEIANMLSNRSAQTIIKVAAGLVALFLVLQILQSFLSENKTDGLMLKAIAALMAAGFALKPDFLVQIVTIGGSL